MAALDLYAIYTFIKRLATPFEEWDAYKEGVIDKDGNILKGAKDRIKTSERASYTKFDNMVLKIKNLIGKVPGGKSRVASYAAALYFIKEDWKHLEAEQLDESIDLHFSEYLDEEMPANAASTGAVAGMGYNGPDDVKVTKSAANKYKRKNKQLAPRRIMGENFRDGKNPERKGLAKRSGVNTKASISDLRKVAKNSTGEKQKMAHWLANMKAGRAKKEN